MKVTEIDILGLHYDAAACHEGLVAIELAPPVAGGALMRLQFLCHSGQGEEAPSAQVARDPVRDSLRQAHRMPGYRRGEREIELAVSGARIGGQAAPA
jgi:hypothetical protein